MNIAILLGVSDYSSLENLPACKNDVDIIYNILSKNEKYNDILFINSDTSSRNVKSKIIEFIKKYKDEDIDEIFIYFSGHGYFDGEEFYYICSDYDKSRVKQTTFENKEFDSYLKSLNPKLTVKVIDACQSGINYIKDINDIKDFFNKGENKFNNCYFMYSSNNNQASFASEKMSHFTNEFINSLIYFKKDIRYKDILDYLSDSFKGKEQTPFFVVQADYTEIFISINEEIEKLLSENLKTTSVERKDENIDKNLFDLVKSDSENYFTKEQVLELLKKIEDKIYGYTFNGNDIEKYFDINLEFCKNYELLPQKGTISNWANTKNKSDYFVKPILEKSTKKTRVPKNNKMLLSLASLSLLGHENNDDLYTIKEEIIDLPVSIQVTTEMLFNYLNIKTKAKFPNLHNISFFLLPFVSKRKIIFFTTFAIYKNINWDEEKIEYSTIQWNNEEFNLKNEKEIFEFVDKKIKEFIDLSINEVKKAVNFNNQEDW